MYGYLIDMDGVIYRGGQLIPGADRFIHDLRAAHIPFLFLTNNSQRTRRDVATKLRRLGLEVEGGLACVNTASPVRGDETCQQKVRVGDSCSRR
jgi:ribonucleotide monophosphatase NagD (HAD superfamily)